MNPLKWTLKELWQRLQLEKVPKKKRCKDCKYQFPIIPYCEAPTVRWCDYMRGGIQFMPIPQQINKTGECKHYKRKWWKFWR